MNYLDIVNRVLRRLREKEVGSINSTAYSKLIGDFVNEVKDEVENAWNWNALRYTFKVDTISGLLNYVLTDAVQNSRLMNAWNDTGRFEMYQMSTHEAELKYLTSRELAQPHMFNFNGSNKDGFLQVDLWPIPDGVYRCTFNMIVPQAELTADNQILKIPARPVVEGAIGRAIRERGEDGGTSSIIQDQRYEKALADAIIFDAQLHPDELQWYPE